MPRSRKPRIDPMTAACAALGRGAWAEARDGFAAASARAGASDVAEALEGLGLAHWWLDDTAATIAARDQAYRLFAARDDALGAARVATWLAGDHLAAGAGAVADDWRRAAHRLIDALPTAPEHGWLAHREGEIALGDGDHEAARTFGASAVEVDRTLAIDELEIVGLALEGLALVLGGDVAAGIDRLDRVTAFGDSAGDVALEASGRYLSAAAVAVATVDRTRLLGLAASAAQWRNFALSAPRRGRE